MPGNAEYYLKLKIMVKYQSSFVVFMFMQFREWPQTNCPKLASRSGRCWSHNIGDLRHPFFVPDPVSAACNHVICVQGDMGVITGKIRYIRCIENRNAPCLGVSAICRLLCCICLSLPRVRPCSGVFVNIIHRPDVSMICLGRSATRNINS